jgi:hypothetical protein
MSDAIEMHVRVTPKRGSYLIEVWDEPATDFARVDSHDLTVGLQMAVPYMRSLTEPGPFDRLAKRPEPVVEMTTISARVPKELADQFTAVASRNGRTFSGELRKLMHEYLTEHAERAA